jgi:hypothetical protein
MPKDVLKTILILAGAALAAGVLFVLVNFPAHF